MEKKSFQGKRQLIIWKQKYRHVTKKEAKSAGNEIRQKENNLKKEKH
jgi:hypothetical protein